MIYIISHRSSCTWLLCKISTFQPNTNLFLSLSENLLFRWITKYHGICYHSFVYFNIKKRGDGYRVYLINTYTRLPACEVVNLILCSTWIFEMFRISNTNASQTLPRKIRAVSKFCWNTHKYSSHLVPVRPGSRLGCQHWIMTM